jgi:hypothetical protein
VRQVEREVSLEAAAVAEDLTFLLAARFLDQAVPAVMAAFGFLAGKKVIYATR